MEHFLLSDKRILEEKEKGNIFLSPFEKRQLGPNSYDARLGEWYYMGNETTPILSLDNPNALREYWGVPKRAENGSIALPPGMTVLAHTQEYVGCKNGFVAKMYARSTTARSGLSVCRCAGVGDNGYSGRWTMELCNHTKTILLLPVGFRICQFTFEEIGPTLQHYQGKYGQDDWKPEDMLPKPHLDWDYDWYRQK